MIIVIIDKQEYARNGLLIKNIINVEVNDNHTLTKLGKVE